MTDFMIDKDGRLTQYTGQGGDVVIPDNVTIIGEFAFFRCNNLISLTIPNSVKNIEKHAFTDCSLTNMTIPGSVKNIENEVFNCCSGLTNVIILNGVKSIGNRAFYECNNLTKVIIPESVKNIGKEAFASCTDLKEVTISEGTSIAESTFSDCPCLANDSGMVIIHNIFFGYFGNEKHIDIPANVTCIGSSAFKNQVNLTSVTIPTGVLCIGDQAFCGCSNLTSVNLPDGMTSIGDWAFYNCKSLTNVTIPYSVTDIGSGAFKGCIKLSGMTIPGILNNYGTEVFANCNHSFHLSLSQGALVATGKLAADLCEVVDSATDKELAFILMYQKAKAWQLWTAARIVNREKTVFDSMLDQLEIDKKVDATVAEFIQNNILKLAPEQVKKAITILEGHKFKNLDKIKNNDAIKSLLTGKTVEEHPIEAFVRECISRKPISQEIMNIVVKGIHYADSEMLCSREALAFIVQAYKKNDSFTEIKEQDYLEQYLDPDAEKIAAALDSNDLSAFALSLIRNGKLHYREFMHVWGRFARGEDINCETHDIDSRDDPRWRTPNIIEALLLSDSTEALLFEYKMGNTKKYAKLRKKTESELRDELLKNLCPTEDIRFLVIAYEKNDQQAINEVEKNVSSQSPDMLSDALTELVEKTGYNLGRAAWIRHANEESIRSACERHIHLSKGKAECDPLGKRFYSELVYSDTLAAMQTFEKYGELDRYAKVHGLTAMEIRDTMMLPAFAFDADGIKRYDIGGNIIEVSITPDLSFRLFDVNKQKEIRSFPKKSDDPAKAEACAKEYAAFKKEVLAFAKERTKLLHRMHITGDCVNGDLWCKVYIEHPVIRHLAQLVVWQDGTEKTFMVVNGETIDTVNNPYTPQGKIRVAHVADMNAADIDAWRQWLTKHGCVQLFEQVWEPVIAWTPETLQARFGNVSMTNTERNALKNLLSKRGVDMRSTGVEREVWYDWGTSEFGEKRVSYGDSARMLFGDTLTVDYKIDNRTLVITFGKAYTHAEPGNREMNTVLAEFDRSTLITKILDDSDAALTAETLSEFTAAQITDFINVAIENKATRCTALLLNYKNEHCQEFADVEEFTLDW